jgi:hypothetical protein
MIGALKTIGLSDYTTQTNKIYFIDYSVKNVGLHARKIIKGLRGNTQ